LAFRLQTPAISDQGATLGHFLDPLRDVFERERTDPRTDPQTDIEFDFFDESPTAEAPPREGGPPRRRRRLPTRPPTPPGGPQLYRLGVLIAGAIVLAVILILVVNSCRANQKKSAYKDYVQDVTEVASQSEEVGKDLNAKLITPGIKLSALRTSVEGFQQRQQQILQTTQGLTPPGPLVTQQESLVEAMQFRVNGLSGLSQAFSRVATLSTDQAGALLAGYASRLVASDVIYLDLFKEGTRAVLDQRGVTDVPVPDSRFLQNPDLASADSWALIVRRLTQGPTSGGLHGNGIVDVRAQPDGQVLSQSADNTVKASEKLAFQVRIQNSGDNQETQVPVTLTVQQDPVIRKQQTIDLIDPGETKTVTFTGFGQIDFSGGSVLKVSVEPVAGEQNTSNNTAQYKVIFTLG
jgi:CARDB protein